MNVIFKRQNITVFPAVSTRPPMYIRFAFCLLVGITAGMLAIRFMTPQSLTSSFLNLSNMVGSDTKQMALARGFVCNDSGFSDKVQSTYDLCTREDSDGIFTRVTLQTLGGDGTQISFLLRDNTLKLGDLVLLWGEPDIRRYCEAIVLRWSAHHTIGLASPTRYGKIDYTLPIRSVIVSRSAVPHIESFMTAGGLSHCTSTGF